MGLLLLLSCVRPGPRPATSTALDNDALRSVSAELEALNAALWTCESKVVPVPDFGWEEHVHACAPVVLGGSLGRVQVGLPLLPADQVTPDALRPVGVSWLIEVTSPNSPVPEHLQLLTRDGAVFILGLDDYMSLPHVVWDPNKLPETPVAAPPGLTDAARHALATLHDGTYTAHTLSFDQCSSLMGPRQCAPDGLYSDIPPFFPLGPSDDVGIALIQVDLLSWDPDHRTLIAAPLELATEGSFDVQAVGVHAQINAWETAQILMPPGPFPEPGSVLSGPVWEANWCESDWPRTDETTAAIDATCMRLMLEQVYDVGADELLDATNGDPGPWPRAATWSTAELDRLRQRVLAQCPVDADYEPFDANRVCVRAIESLDRAIQDKANLTGDLNTGSYGPLLCKVLDGQPLTDADLLLHTELRWTDQALAVLRAGVKVRAGYRPVSDDAMAVFLAPRDDPDAPCLPVQAPSGHARHFEGAEYDTLDLLLRAGD
jgi:hypothetical protein